MFSRKNNRLRRTWIQAVERTSSPKTPRLSVGVLPEVIPTIFPHKPARSVHVVNFGFLYTSGVSCHCVCVATSCVLTNLLSLSLLGASTTRSAGRSRWFVGKIRGNSLRFKFLLPRARSKQLILKSHRVFEAISIQMLRTQ